MKSTIQYHKIYEVNLKLNVREISMLQALFGLGDLPEHLGKSFAEYKEPSKELFKEMHETLHRFSKEV